MSSTNFDFVAIFSPSRTSLRSVWHLKLQESSSCAQLSLETPWMCRPAHRGPKTGRVLDYGFGSQSPVEPLSGLPAKYSHQANEHARVHRRRLDLIRQLDEI